MQISFQIPLPFPTFYLIPIPHSEFRYHTISESETELKINCFLTQAIAAVRQNLGTWERTAGEGEIATHFHVKILYKAQ